MDITKQSMYVINWTNDKVQCEMIHKHVREFDRDPLFQGMKLFKGKNVSIKIVVNPGSITASIVESKKNKILQLYNYWVR